MVHSWSIYLIIQPTSLTNYQANSHPSSKTSYTTFHLYANPTFDPASHLAYYQASHSQHLTSHSTYYPTFKTTIIYNHSWFILEEYFHSSYLLPNLSPKLNLPLTQAFTHLSPICIQLFTQPLTQTHIQILPNHSCTSHPSSHQTSQLTSHHAPDLLPNISSILEAY